jgi:hypothetical protein
MNNIYLNKDSFIKHHQIEFRNQRINDFKEIYKILKNNLKPKSKASINEKNLNKYINLYKKENKEFIREVIQNTVYVSFKKFYAELKFQIEKFNRYLKDNSISKYVFVLGVGSDSGASTLDFNIFKSNLWVFMLGWKYLKIKPYDILLNLNTALRLHYPKIKDFLLVDDCSYSGDQMFNQVIKVASTEFLFHDKKGYLIKTETKNTVYQPIQEKLANIHLVIPYLSKIAYEKIKELDLLTGFNIIRYNSYIINPFKDILNSTTLKTVSELYKNFYKFVDFGNLIPIFFEHKIADMISTIDLILIKGQVIDEPKKRLVFVDSCEYSKKTNFNPEYNYNKKDFNYDKIYCPEPPYLFFQQILKKYYNQ